MLLLIGLQSGKGLHPDQIINCQNCQDCQKSPKLILRSNLLVHPNRLHSSFSIWILLAITNSWQLSLSLFMFRVFADHAHHALAVHDLALVTNLLY
jgi:hypothetical protein